MNSQPRDPSCHYHLRQLARNRWTFDVVLCTNPQQYARPNTWWPTEQAALLAAKHEVTQNQTHTHDCTMRHVNVNNHPGVVAYNEQLSRNTQVDHHPLKSKVVLAEKDTQ